MTSSAADAPRDGDDDDLGDIPEGLLPEGVLDDAAEDDAPARSKPTPSPRKPPPSSSPSRLDARGEDDKSALDATVPKVSPGPDLSFTSSRARRPDTTIERRARRSRRAPRRVSRPAVPPVTGFDPCVWHRLVFHPRAGKRFTDRWPDLSPPPAAIAGEHVVEQPTGRGEEPGRHRAAHPRSPRPGTTSPPFPSPAPRPFFSFPSLLFLRHGLNHASERDIDRWAERKVPRWRGAATRVATDADAGNPR